MQCCIMKVVVIKTVTPYRPPLVFIQIKINGTIHAGSPWNNLKYSNKGG